MVVGLVISLCAASTADATTIATNITTNTTLTAAKSPYTGTSVKVKSGVTLTISPGVKVQLTGTLEIAGTLKAEGTSTSPIILTSKEDSAPGQWTGLIFLKSSGKSAMTHVLQRYAADGIQIRSSSPSIDHGKISDNSQSSITVEGGSPVIEDDTISDNGRGVAYSFPASSPGSVHFDGNLVEGNGGDGLEVSAPTAETRIESATVGQNSFVDNAGKAILYDAYATTAGFHSNPVPPDISTNLLSGNAEEGVWLRGLVGQSATWQDHGYAFVTESEGIIVGGGATLTLGPGVVVKSPAILVDAGDLVAAGTGSDPVLLTSLSDDSADGDTNGDGGATTPAPGDWDAVTVGSAGGATLGHAILRYGGWSGYGGDYTSFAAHCPCSGGISIEDTTVRRSLSGGILLDDTEATVKDSTVTENAEAPITVEGGSPVIEDDTISDNGRGVAYSFPASSPGSVHFDGNLVEGNGGDGFHLQTEVANGLVGNSSLGENNFVKNEGRAVYFAAFSIAASGLSNSLPTDITTNSLSENEMNGIWLSGGIYQSTTWENKGYALVEVGNGTTVEEGATLTLGKDLVVKGEGGSGLKVNGVLKSEGAVLTSLADDSVGGDTNGNALESYPQPGDWDGITYPVASSASLANVSIRYAARAVNAEYLSSMTVSDSSFVSNIHAVEIGTMPPGGLFAPKFCGQPHTAFFYLSGDSFSPPLSPYGANGVSEPFPPEWYPSFATDIGMDYSMGEPNLNMIPFYSYRCPSAEKAGKPAPIPPVGTTPIRY